MFIIPNQIYYKLRQKEIKKAKVMLRRMKINRVFEILTKCCWKYGLSYEIIIKNNELLLIKLCGNKESTLLKFHKSDMVFIEDYERFIALMSSNGVKKGIYITTGVFEGKILKVQRGVFPFINDIRIEDGHYFIRKQLGLRRKSIDIFKNKELNFFSYLPN